MGDTKEEASRPRRRASKWFWRTIRIGFLLLLVSFLLLAWAANWASRNLVEILNWAGDALSPRVKVAAEDFEWVPPASIRSDHLILSLPGDARPLAIIDSLTADVAWSWEGGFYFQNLNISGLRVRLKPDQLDRLQQEMAKFGGAPSVRASPEIDSEEAAPLAWKLDQVRVEKSHFDLATPDGFRVRGEWNGVLKHLDPSFHTESLQHLAIKNLELERAGESIGGIAAVELSFTLADAANERLRTVHVEAPRLKLRETIFASAEQAADVAPDTAVTDADPLFASDWVVDQLSVEQGWAQYSHPLPDGTRAEAQLRFSLPSSRLRFDPDSLDLLPFDLADFMIRTGLDSQAPIRVKTGKLTIDPDALINDRSVEWLQLDSGDVRLDGQLQQLLQRLNQAEADSADIQRSAADVTKSSQAPAFKVQQLDMRSVRLNIQDLDPDLPSLVFPIDTTMQEVQWPPKAGADREPVVVEVGPVTLPSPLDPLTPVITFPNIFVKFVPGELLQQRLRAVIILHPRIFVGDDLFWYIDVVQKRTSGPGIPSPESQLESEPVPAGFWRVDHFAATQGQLEIITGPGREIPLPIPFSAEANDVRFDSLAQLQVRLDLNVPEADYRFPDYQLAFLDLSGAIDFSLPPGGDANNLVNKLVAQTVLFRQFEGREVWLAVTFDLNGVHGEFGGEAYSGYLNGGFTLGMKGENLWEGWISGADIDLEAVTKILVPNNLLWTGGATFTLQVSGARKVIHALDGKLQAEEGGKFLITKLNDLIEAIPEDWAVTRTQITQLGLETLRDFTYDQVRGIFQYQHRAGYLQLDMTGPDGKRLLEVQLHPPGVTAASPP